MTAAAAAVLLSFVVIGVFVRGQTGGPRHPRLNLLRWRAGRGLADRRVRVAAQAVSVGLLLLVLATGLAGEQTPTRNLAPTMVWIVWWVGFAYVSALVGDLWAVVNPWAAVFAGIEALAARSGRRVGLGLRYPARLGSWPATGLFAAFAWVELVYSGRAVPALLAMTTIVYSLTTWTGMVLFGRAVWLRYGDPFAVAFGVLARFAPTEAQVTPAGEREWNLRPYGTGLLRTSDVSPSMVVFVVLLLSTVTFDGFTATPAWARLENGLYAALPALGDARLTVISSLGLIAFPLSFLLVYGLFALWMARAAGGELSTGTVARIFVLSLVPIAIAYHVAHYLTYLMVQGQLMIRLVSDPFGFGWNLLGTARHRPDVGIVGARFTWYTAVIAIVAGHIVAVYTAHVVALREFSNRRAALRSQFPMLVLMVGYTIVSLWIIAQPIVEAR